MVGVLLTLGFVLALLGVALKLLRKFAPRRRRARVFAWRSSSDSRSDPSRGSR
jgi:hypothetical protein